MNNILPGGMNILAMANLVIGQSEIMHSRFKENMTGTDGIITPVYFQPPARCLANVQPMPREMIEKQGFDVQKTYVVIYTEADLHVGDTERSRAPDLVDFGCDRYIVESNTPWIDQNGWRGSVCCKIGRVP